jgi:hypothetical protein
LGHACHRQSATRIKFALSLGLASAEHEVFNQKTPRISQTKVGRPHLLPLPGPTIPASFGGTDVIPDISPERQRLAAAEAAN